MSIENTLRVAGLVEGMGKAVEAVGDEHSRLVKEMLENGVVDENLLKKLVTETIAGNKLLRAGREIVNLMSVGSDRNN